MTEKSLHLVAKETLVVGQPSEIFGESHLGRFATVFEDDGETGYFYALDGENKDNQICDALHIYDVSNVVDVDVASEVEILWSEDGLKSVLLINNYPYAVFDFESRRGYCRTNFPKPNSTWTRFDHQWDDAALVLFK